MKYFFLLHFDLNVLNILWSVELNKKSLRRETPTTITDLSTCRRLKHKQHPLPNTAQLKHYNRRDFFLHMTFRAITQMEISISARVQGYTWIFWVALYRGWPKSPPMSVALIIEELKHMALTGNVLQPGIDRGNGTLGTWDELCVADTTHSFLETPPAVKVTARAQGCPMTRIHKQWPTVALASVSSNLPVTSEAAD